MARDRSSRSVIGRLVTWLVFIIIGVILFSIIASNSGYDSTEINEIGLIYEGGVVQDKSYKGLLDPGSTNNRVGLGSTVYRYRIDQRSWIAKAGDTTDTVPVTIVSEDDVRLSVES